MRSPPLDILRSQVAKGFAEAIFDAEEFGDFLLYPQAEPGSLGSNSA